jgi:uncharacterized protein DUF6602
MSGSPYSSLVHSGRYASNMDMLEFFAAVEATFLARFQASAAVAHPGDKGENRELILREFLRDHLPKRYGVTKGHVVTQNGTMGHSADVIIYDALGCPVLYQEQTSIIPIEGVYGIIEVKSSLAKPELIDAMGKIEGFKRLASRELGIIQTRHYMTVHRPSRPFGIVFAYQLSGNSLSSLKANYEDEHKHVQHVDFFTNLVSVLGTGLIHCEKADLNIGEKSPLLDTDEFVDLLVLQHKRARLNELIPEIFVRAVADELGNRSFGRFFVYLLIMLARLRLNVPDLGRYLEPGLPMQIVRES